MKFKRISNKEGKDEAIIWASTDKKWVLRYHYPEESASGKKHTTMGPMTRDMTATEMFATSRRFKTKKEALRYIRKQILLLQKIDKI